MDCVRTVAIVNPTYNCMRTLDAYMPAVNEQTYPHDKIEIIFADGGSTDGTIEKFEEYKKEYDIKISVYDNTLRTAEAGKAVGVNHANTDIVLLLDSDNIIPDSNWLN